MTIAACRRWLVAALLPFATAAQAEPAPLRLATYAYPAYDRQQALAPLARLIERASGRPVVVALFASPDALADATRRGDVDVAVTNLAAFIQIAALPGARAIAVPKPPAATLERYRGVLLVRRDAGAARLADLRVLAPRLRYAEVLPGSTSGALVQAEALREAGIETARFRRTDHAGTHDAALARLLDGEAEVAAMAEGPWLALQATRPDAAATLVPLWRSSPLPPGPVVCMADPTVPCARIARAMLRPGDASRTAAAALARGWSETAGARAFGRYDAARYAAFVALPRQPGAARRTG